MSSGDQKLTPVFVALVLLTAGGVLAANGCNDGDDPDPYVPPVRPSNEPTSPPSPKPTPPPEPSPPPEPTEDNVMNITVNGAYCRGTGLQYPNEPCVQITICSPTTGECQEPIDNILLDTGSYGLRVFKSEIKVPLTQVTTDRGDLAECVQFGDGTSEWGPVQYADIKLGKQPKVRVPIHLIDWRHNRPPNRCSRIESVPDMSPAQTGFKGILGVGMLVPDCGEACEVDPSNGQYYSCTATGCAPTTVSAEKQVRNPVAGLPRDNNGVILRFPPVDPNGAVSVDGQMILGIGTQPNNQPGNVKVYGADEYSNFTTVFEDYSKDEILSFIDSGSSVLFFPPPQGSAVPDCDSAAGGKHGSGYAGFYCPASTVSLFATNFSVSSRVEGIVPFQVGNAYELFKTSETNGNMVFPTMANSSSIGFGAVFDWGLPFFFGKDVYVGIRGKYAAGDPKLDGAVEADGLFWAY